MQPVSSPPPTNPSAGGPAPYHLTLADLIAYELTSSPSPFAASIHLWNALANLQQRGFIQPQLAEFLTRLFNILSPAHGPPPPVRFSGQSSTQLNKSVKQPPGQGSSPAASSPGHPGAPAGGAAPSGNPGPYWYILQQIGIARRMIGL